MRGPGFEQDPAYYRSSLVGFGIRGLGGAMLQYPRSWWDDAETLYDSRSKWSIPALDPTAQYKIRVVYAGDSVRPKIRLTANDGIEIHPLLARPVPFHPLEFDIPREATAQGDAPPEVVSRNRPGRRGPGLQIAEVWLIRK